MADEKDEFWGETPAEETPASESQTPDEETPDEEPSEEEPAGTGESEGEPESEKAEGETPTEEAKPKDKAAFWQSKYQEATAKLKKLQSERVLGERGVERKPDKPEQGQEADVDRFYDNPVETLRNVVRAEIQQARAVDVQERWTKERDAAFAEVQKWAKDNDCVDEFESACEYVTESMVGPSGAWPVRANGQPWTPMQQAEHIKRLTLANAAPEVVRAATEKAKADAEAKHERKLGKATPASDGGGTPPKPRAKTAEEKEIDDILDIGSLSPEAKEFFGK